MAISVSIGVRTDNDGGYSIDVYDGCPHSFVDEMYENKGVWLGTDGFIPLTEITDLWFGDAVVDKETVN